MRTWQNLCSAPLLTRSRGFGLSDGTAGSHFSEPRSAGRRLTPALLDVLAAGPDPGRPAHFRTRELKRPEGTVAALLTEARSQAHQSDPRERDTHGLGGDDQAVMACGEPCRCAHCTRASSDYLPAATWRTALSQR